MAEIYRSNGRVKDAETCLDLIAVYNVDPAAKEFKDKWVRIMKTEDRIIEYKISSNIDGFDIVGQKTEESVLNEIKPKNQGARRFSVRPKLPRKSGESSSDEDTNELSRSSKMQKTEPKPEINQTSPSEESAKEIIDKEEVRKSKERKVAFQTTEKENFKPPSDPIKPNHENKNDGLKTPKNKTTSSMTATKTPATISKEKSNYRKSAEHKITIDGLDYTVILKSIWSKIFVTSL